MRLIFPILLALLGVGLFVVYTNPTYQTIKGLQDQSNQYNYALTQSTQLRQLRDTLLQRRNAFTTDQVQSLERLLPDNVDNIRFIIDLNDIAARQQLQVKDVGLSTSQNQGASVAGTGPVGYVDVTFTVTASYQQFLAFLQNLEHSLRLIDIESIKFTAGATTNDYTLQVRTYWLR